MADNVCLLISLFFLFSKLHLLDYVLPSLDDLDYMEDIWAYDLHLGQWVCY